MLELKDKPHDTQAWDRFLDLGLPTKKSESYRYVRLKALYSQLFQSPTISQPDFQPEEGTFVFVNGSYCDALSSIPKPLLALPLSKASKAYSSFLTPRLQKLLKEEQDPFAVLNHAYCGEGLFLYIPPKAICEVPLRIVHLIENVENSTLLCPRIHLFAGKSAQAKLLFSQKIGSELLWINSFIDCALEENASISLKSVANQHEKAHHFFSLRATLKQHSTLKTLSATNGGATSREDYAVRLLGEGCDVSLLGVWGLNKARQHHVNILMDHQEPNCTSLQKFKGVLADNSRSSFEGKIYVHEKAQKTQAYQMNNNLVLGTRASANSKPNLEIFADDVKASHGATVGQLDDEQLFYLTTRGLPADVARQLLVQGFNREILDQIEDPILKKESLDLFR